MSALSRPVASLVISSDAPAGAVAATDRAWIGPATELAGLAAIAALALARHLWVAQAVSLILLLTIPGAIALRALRVERRAIAAFPVYVPAASVAVMMFAALAVDAIGLAVGLDAPLRVWPLLVGLEAVCLLMLVVVRARQAAAGVAWGLPRIRLVEVWPLVLPVIAAIGAARLTNGHDGAVAVVALVLSIATLLYGVVFGDRLSPAASRCLVFGVALALAWSFALRGSFVFGYDISSEYHVLDETLRTGTWHAAHRDDAYGAMLSLTVLPALLHALSGASALLMLKATYPVLLALFSVGLLDLARRYVQPRFAVLAIAIVVSQSYFFQQMPAIARQEVALLLFVALLAAILDTRLRRGPAVGLVGVLGLGMVVSHYSTTYLAVGMLLVATILGVLLRLGKRPVVAIPFVVCALVVIGAGAGVWYGAVTKSTQNVSSFTDNLRDKGLQILPNRKDNQGLLSAYLTGNTDTTVSAQRYQQLIEANYAKNRSFITPLPAAANPQYALTKASLGIKTETAPGEGLRLLASIATQFFNLLAAVAALVALLSRRSSPGLRGVALLGVATLVALTLLRLSGTAATAYNQERAFVQSMVVLAIGIAAAFQWASGRGRRLAWLAGVVAAGAVLLVIAGGSGLRGHTFGGGTGAVNLSNSGEDYERFLSRTSELSAARWMQGVVKPQSGALRYTDNYGQLRVLAASGSAFGLLTGVTPLTLDRHAWVYGSTTNIVSGRARGSVDRHSTLYKWPSAFLDRYYNRVFANGGAAIYHR